MVWIVALRAWSAGDRARRLEWERDAYLLTLERRVVVALVRAAHDAQLGRLHVERMSREVGQFLAGLSEEEGRILARGDSRIDFRSRSCTKSAGKRTRERGCQ